MDYVKGEKMESNRMKTRIIDDSKVSHNGQLGKGVIWTLQQFNNLTKKEISELIGWKVSSVCDELNRLKKSVLGCLMIIENEDDKLSNTYTFNELGKKADLDLLVFLGRENFKKSEQMLKDVRKIISHI